jgi:hypothetical protein
MKLPFFRQKWMLGFMILSLISAAAISIPKAKDRWTEVYLIRKNVVENRGSWMYGGRAKLDSAVVSLDRPIFVLYDFAPNTSLIYFNRKGIVFNHEEMARKTPHLEFWLDQVKPSCLIIQSIWEEQLKKDKPEIYKTWTIRRFDTFILLDNPDRSK